MNTWSQEEEQQQELHNLLLTGYECKPVKKGMRIVVFRGELRP